MKWSGIAWRLLVSWFALFVATRAGLFSFVPSGGARATGTRASLACDFG